MKDCQHYLRLITLCAIFITFIFGVSCNLPKRHMSLEEAAYYGDIELAKNSLEANADINQKDFKGYTPLMIATYHNNHNIVVYLLENSADIDLQGTDGRTALILATCNMNTRMIKTLLKYKPDINIKDKGGFSALDHAYNLNLKTISKILEGYIKK